MQAFERKGWREKTYVTPSGFKIKKQYFRVKVLYGGPYANAEELPKLSERSKRLLEFAMRKIADFYREIANVLIKHGYNVSFIDPAHPEKGIVVDVPKDKEAEFEKEWEDKIMYYLRTKKLRKMIEEIDNYAWKKLGFDIPVEADITDISVVNLTLMLIIIDDNGFSYGLYYEISRNYDKGKYTFTPVTREVYVIPIDPLDEASLHVLTSHLLIDWKPDSNVHMYEVPIEQPFDTIDWDELVEQGFPT